MGFLRQLGNPITGEKSLANPRPDLFRHLTYQHMASNRGLPAIGLRLTPNRSAGRGGGGGAANPDMTLAVLLDRSGSMAEAYRDGHVYNAASTILNYVAAAGTGFDLVFYNHAASYAGHIRTDSELRAAIQQNQPTGGTTVLEALQGTIKRYKQRAGLYIIVITDGEFSDKTQVQSYIVQTLLPQLTPANPYAFRLHFVGAGEGVDREFLEQLEQAASGQGIQLVKAHHHAHLRHSHDSMLDELDGAFLGYGPATSLGERLPDQSTAAVVTRVGNLDTNQWVEGRYADIGFVPRRVQLGIEFSPEHPADLDARLSFHGVRGTEEIPLRIPLPRVTATAATHTPAPPKPPRFHLPWHHATPEDTAARAAADQERGALLARVEQVRQDEARRQTEDARVLGQGGIPTMARQRLTESRQVDPEHASFTSDLAPDELALLRRNGFRPLGLVSGSAMYHVGTAYASAYNDCEVAALSKAYQSATYLAVNRMEQEAQLLGAVGVVGVRFDIVRREWSEKSIEVQLIGTAIAGQGPTPQTPWLSDLSGQEWYALHRAGYDPAGLVYGNCTWFVLTTQADEWNERSYANQELSHFSQALSQCRNHASKQIKDMARRLKAVGVVGVHISRHLEEIRLYGPGENPAYEREHHNLTLSVIGTAVRPRPDAPTQVRGTTHVLSLLDGRLVPRVVTTTSAKFE